MNLNTITRIHMIAICGMGMGSLAGMLKGSGFLVSGSDQNVYPPMDEQLKGLDIPVYVGYRPANLNPPPDLVIVGNAVSRDNPEVQAMLSKSIPYLSFPQALKKFYLEEKRSIVIAGTHGKTTTSALLSWLIESAGKDPGFMVGGIIKNFNKNYKIGSGEYFVVEGDEYDTAFFDKGPKFLHYKPEFVILTSVEFDHADIYRDFEQIKSAFIKLIEIIPEDGLLVANCDDPTVGELIQDAPCPVVTFSTKARANWEVGSVWYSSEGTHFDIFYEMEKIEPFFIPLIGAHNVQNAVGAMAIAKHIGISFDQIREGLKTFQGVKRRQEIRGVVNGIVIIDDFAHHPTAVKATIDAVKAAYSKNRVWSIFEPRSNTSRRNIFQKEFVEAFLESDKIIIAGVYNPEKIADDERLSPRDLVDGLHSKGKNALYIERVDDIVEYLCNNLSKGDVVLIMSNGGFGGINEKLLNILRMSN